MNIMADDERDDAPGGDDVRLDEIEATEATQGGDESEDEPEQAQGGDDDRGETSGDDEDEDVILFGDEAAPASEDEEGTPQWVKDLRKRARELERENKALKDGKAAPAAQPTLRPKPKLEDHDYDDEAFAADLEAWVQEKAQDDAAKAAAQQQQEAAKAAWTAKLDAYGQKKSALRVPDFDDAEAEVTTKLNQAQQAIIVAYCANPAVVTYALGKRPEKLAELAKIEDPIAFAIAASKLEGDLKVQKRSKPAPEGRLSGSAPTAAGADKHLERLEAEADRTGDRSKVIAYKREQRQRQGK